jgi:hypothetical protein
MQIYVTNVSDTNASLEKIIDFKIIDSDITIQYRAVIIGDEIYFPDPIRRDIKDEILFQYKKKEKKMK